MEQGKRKEEKKMLRKSFNFDLMEDLRFQNILGGYVPQIAGNADQVKTQKKRMEYV